MTLLVLDVHVPQLTAGGSLAEALRIYGLIVFAIAVIRVAIWLYATSRPHLLWPGPRCSPRRR